MVFNIGLVALFIGMIWLLALTIYVWKLQAHYNELIQTTDKKSLQSVLEMVLRELEKTQKEVKAVITRCDKIEKDGNLHIQKIGLLRFNPFKDTGGDQSFIVSLVDAKDTGVVISGLYSRSGTRWYAKRVINGQGTDHELSDEEKKALKIAHVA
jgi:hypothetical protein